MYKRIIELREAYLREIKLLGEADAEALKRISELKDGL